MKDPIPYCPPPATPFLRFLPGEIVQHRDSRYLLVVDCGRNFIALLANGETEVQRITDPDLMRHLSSAQSKLTPV